MIVISSVRSSGATTLALALAGWLRRPLVVEADPDGGVLAMRYSLGREPGLLTLAAARGVDGSTVFEHAQALPGGMPVVVAPESPARCTHLLQAAGDQLAAMLGGIDGVDAVIDAGRLSPPSPAWCFVAEAAKSLVLARPLGEELLPAAERVTSIRAQGADAELVLVGTGPYSASDVTSQLGCPVAGTIAEDQRAARILAEGGSTTALARSALSRTARELAATIVRRDARDVAQGNGHVEVPA